MGNLKIEYLGTLIFAAMAAGVALAWTVAVCIERSRTKSPDLQPDFQQVQVFGGIAVLACVVLLGLGV